MGMSPGAAQGAHFFQEAAVFAQDGAKVAASL